MRPLLNYENHRLISRLGGSDRAERWLATEPILGRQVQIKRFDAIPGSDWQAQKEWFELIEQLRLLRSHSPAFTVPIERLAQDHEGLWYTVTPWIEATPCVPAPYEPIPALKTSHIPPLILAAALAVQSALELGQQFGLSKPVMHGFDDPLALLGTPLGGLMTGFDRIITPPTPDPSGRRRSSAEGYYYLRNRWESRRDAAPHNGHWEPWLDVWSLGMLLRFMLAMENHPRQLKRPPRDPLKAALFEIANQAQPESPQRPTLTLEGFIEALGELNQGAMPVDTSQMSETQALLWLRARAAEGNADTVLDLFNLSPNLLHSPVVTDYAWGHFGPPLLDAVAEGTPQSSVQARMLATMPPAAADLEALLQNRMVPGPGRAEAVRLLGYNPGESAGQAIVRALNDPWPQVRQRAQQALKTRPKPVPIGLTEPSSAKPVVSLSPCSFDWDDLEDEETLTTGHTCRFCAMCERRVVRAADIQGLRTLLGKGHCAYFSPTDGQKEGLIPLIYSSAHSVETTWLLGPGDHFVIGGEGSQGTDLQLEECSGMRVLVEVSPKGTLEVTVEYDANPQASRHLTITPGQERRQGMNANRWYGSHSWHTYEGQPHVHLAHYNSRLNFTGEFGNDMILGMPSGDF